MHFEVNRQNFRETRAIDSTHSELAPGEIRLAVERFALTTNNITYAVVGDMLDYWGFFPTEAPWGRLPAMGLGSVTESAHPEIELGGRYFGFYPMASELVIQAEAKGNAFRDIGPHRANHAAAYTNFTAISDDVMFHADKVDEYLLFRGLFMTSYLADDQLADQDFLGATQTLVTSASSKTSICLAACLALRPGHRAVGLTSEGNRAFVEDLGLYDQTITYDEVDQLDASVSSGLVDMAGSAAARSSVHEHFRDSLRYSLTVGATHWEEPGSSGEPLPGPVPEFFFAPTQMAKRTAEWGAAELMNRTASAFHSLLDGTDRWLTVLHSSGHDGVAAVYRELLEGQADPAVGHVVSMVEGGFGLST